MPMYIIIIQISASKSFPVQQTECEMKNITTLNTTDCEHYYVHEH